MGPRSDVPGGASRFARSTITTASMEPSEEVCLIDKRDHEYGAKWREGARREGSSGKEQPRHQKGCYI